MTANYRLFGRTFYAQPLAENAGYITDNKGETEVVAHHPLIKPTAVLYGGLLAATIIGLPVAAFAAPGLIPATVGWIIAGSTLVAGIATSILFSVQRASIERENDQTRRDKVDLLQKTEDAFTSAMCKKYGTIGKEINPDDFGRMIGLDDGSVEDLPLWVQAKVYQAQRDITLVSYYQNKPFKNDEKRDSQMIKRFIDNMKAVARVETDPEKKVKKLKAQRDWVVGKLPQLEGYRGMRMVDQDHDEIPDLIGNDPLFPAAVAGSLLLPNDSTLGKAADMYVLIVVTAQLLAFAVHFASQPFKAAFAKTMPNRNLDKLSARSQPEVINYGAYYAGKKSEIDRVTREAKVYLTPKLKVR